MKLAFIGAKIGMKGIVWLIIVPRYMSAGNDVHGGIGVNVGVGVGVGVKVGVTVGV